MATGSQFQKLLVVFVPAARQFRPFVGTGLALDDETCVVLQQRLLPEFVELEFGIGCNAFELGEARRVTKAADMASGDGVNQPIRALVLKVQHVHDDIGIEDDRSWLPLCFGGHRGKRLRKRCDNGCPGRFPPVESRDCLTRTVPPDQFFL